MSVGVSRSGKTELCLWKQWRRSTVNISDDWWEGFWLRITASVQGASITSGRCSKMARRLTPPETIDVKMSFIEQNMTLWPPNNPDLNLVEYAVWGVLQEMVYQCRSFKSVQELQSVIVAAWQQLSQAFLEQSISEWRRRLENVVQCNGEHITHVC